MDLLVRLQPIAGPLVALIIILYSLWSAWANQKKTTGNGPPQPKGRLPLLGHLHMLGGSPEMLHHKLAAMADDLGHVFMLQLGVHRWVVVSSWETARECFTTNDLALSTRPASSAAQLMGFGYAIFGFAPYGPYWREVRKIATLQLLSNSRLESLKHVRAAEVGARMRDLHRRWATGGGASVAVELKKWCGDLTTNVVTKMVVGKRCFGDAEAGPGEAEVERIRGFREAIGQFFYLLGVFVPSDALPFLKWLDLHGYKKAMKKTGAEFDCVLRSWMEEHRARRTAAAGEKQEDKDFMDVMMSIMEGEGDRDQFSGHDPDTVVKATCMDAHVGDRRNVEESDIQDLVYLQAIIKETLRMTPAAPISVPRQAMSDIRVGGHHVPAGTRLLLNLWKIHRDPCVWPDPMDFRPERFLTTHAHIDLRDHNFEYMPFGAGRRSCPGISLSLRVLHLALARVLHGSICPSRRTGRSIWLGAWASPHAGLKSSSPHVFLLLHSMNDNNNVKRAAWMCYTCQNRCENDLELRILEII